MSSLIGQFFKYIGSGGKREKRIGLGYKLGQVEHKWRWWGYVLFWWGIIVLAVGCYLWNKWVIYIAFFILAASLICETISYIAHRFEKKAMDAVRRGKI
jgi:hypothetical protein